MLSDAPDFLSILSDGQCSPRFFEVNGHYGTFVRGVKVGCGRKVIIAVVLIGLL